MLFRKNHPMSIVSRYLFGRVDVIGNPFSILVLFSFHLHVYSSLLLMNVSSSTSITFSLYTVAGIYIPSVIVIVFPFSYWFTCRDFNNYKDRALTTSTPPLPLAVLSFIFLS